MSSQGSHSLPDRKTRVTKFKFNLCRLLTLLSAWKTVNWVTPDRLFITMYQQFLDCYCSNTTTVFWWVLKMSVCVLGGFKWIRLYWCDLWLPLESALPVKCVSKVYWKLGKPTDHLIGQSNLSWGSHHSWLLTLITLRRIFQTYFSMGLYAACVHEFLTIQLMFT